MTKGERREQQPPRLLQRLIARAARLLAQGIYRSVEVDNTEPGWSHYPSIIVANHPTGFSDPALLFGLLERNPRFLAKATLWDTPGVGWFLDGVGAIPVYRAQDGSTTRNAETFAAAYAALGEGEAIAMFPEGKAYEPPHLAPIKTGAARLALGAVEAGVGGLHIVPIGIHYEERAAVRSRAYVHVGDVLDTDSELRTVLGDLPSTPEDHAAVQRLTTEIERRLAESAPDYATEDEARTLGFAAEVALRSADQPDVAYSERERLAAAVRAAPPPAATDVVAAALRYEEALDDAGVSDRDVVRAERPVQIPWTRILLLILVLPFAAAGVVLNVLPYMALMVAMRLRHEAMTPSTIRMAAAVLSFLAMWLVWAIAATAVWNWRMGLVALIAAPLYGAIALYALDRIASTWRFFRGRRRLARLDPHARTELHRARSRLLDTVGDAVTT